jgi:DNA-binding LacI/PurR family transcriptional regulator
MTPTIKDVAAHAGVSIGIVSRAFHNYTDISNDTREKVLRSAKELGYFPNINASSLSSKRPPNIALIISGLLEGDEKDTMPYSLFRGVYGYRLKNGLEVAVYATDSEEQKRKSYVSFCRERNISGVILMGVTMDDEYLKELINADIPCVALDVPLAGKNFGWVSADNREASAQMVRYLLGRGHQDICIVAGKKNTTVNTERLEGVLSAYSEAGIAFDRGKILWGDFSEEKAGACVRAHILGGGTCTAFLCFSDVMAYGTIQAIQRLGFGVPAEYSVTGFDGQPFTKIMSPKLTTMKQNAYELGYEAAKMLHGILKGGDGGHFVFRCEICEGESVRRI